MLIEMHILQNIPLSALAVESNLASHTCFYGGAKRAWISHSDVERTLRKCKLPAIDSSGRAGKKVVCANNTCPDCDVPMLESALYGKSASPRAVDCSEAAVHIAHVISTQSLEESVDYFSEADTLQSGHIDFSKDNEDRSVGETVCCYRYSSIDLEALKSNLYEQPIIESFLNNESSHASALDNAWKWFLNRTLGSSQGGNDLVSGGPNSLECVLVEAKPFPIPVSYANAFLEPVEPSSAGSIAEKSTERLLIHADRVASDYRLKAEGRYLYTTSLQQSASMFGTRVDNCSELLQRLSEVISS